VVLHGINDNCSGWMGQLSDNFGNRLGSYSKCIETGADISSISTSVKYQAEKACDMINQDDNFKNDFIIVALSQGNLIGRYILQACQMQGTVKKYVSIGGPHMGVGKIPQCPDSLIWCKLIDYFSRKIVYSDLIQNNLSAAGYFKDNFNYNSYLKSSSLLATLNNEREVKNEEYKKRFMNLDKLILIKFTQDEMISPNDSEWFAYYKNNSMEIVPVKESEFYINDFIGFRVLDEQSKIIYAEINNKHVKFSWNDMEKFVIPHLI
jgi:palmitoyl-protein thioesterase